MLEHTSISEQERSQIVQTIEMFEVITQTQPDDYQSLEILKDAYAKLGRTKDALRTSRRLAEAYFNVGSYAQAAQECEELLAKEPNAPEVLAMLGDIESRLQAMGHSVGGNGAEVGLIEKHLQGGFDGGLITEVPRVGGPFDGSLMHGQARNGTSGGGERGEEQLAKFFIMQQLFTEEEVAAAVETVRGLNSNLEGQGLAASLIEKLCGPDETKADAVMSALIDRTKFAYVPLEYYDLDRQVARMLPEELTLGRLFVPFDLISRTIMIACCNPFDGAGREAVQQSLDYTVAWYLARPSAVTKALQDAYRLEGRA